MARLLANCISEKGNFRNKNQDRAVCKVWQDNAHNFAVACVCDGIGSMEMSELSSEMVIKGICIWFQGVMKHYFSLTQQDILDDLAETINELNDIVCEYRKQKGIEIGCTMSLLLILDDDYYIYHVGDSRICLLQDELYQLTIDETVQKNVNGKVRSYLANYMGKKTELQMKCWNGHVRKGDIFILGTDGLFHYLEMADLKDVKTKLHSDFGMKKLNQKIVKAVRARGEKDNVSSILLYQCDSN